MKSGRTFLPMARARVPVQAMDPNRRRSVLGAVLEAVLGAE